MKKHKLDVPYVVSADLAILVKRWCNRKDFACPNQSFFDELRSQFTRYMKTIFPNFDFVSERELREGFLKLYSKSRFPFVSLERVYDEKTPDKFRLDFCRNEEHRGGGIMERFGFPYPRNQIENLCHTFNRSYKDISLWDDVIYTGSLIGITIQHLKVQHLLVREVFSGIGVQTVDGLKGGCEKLRDAGVSVKCIREYGCVIDQVCERDFYPGILFGGRSVWGDKNFSRPYPLPFGNPRRWASIPENCERNFSRFCIGITVRLFEEIERLSNRKVYAIDLDRKIFHYPKGKVCFPKNSVRHVDALKRALEIVG